MIEDFYKPDSEDSLQKKYPLCSYCGEKLKVRIQKPMAVKFFLFFLPLKRYRCVNCTRLMYKLGK